LRGILQALRGRRSTKEKSPQKATSSRVPTKVLESREFHSSSESEERMNLDLDLNSDQERIH
jgi:hypothetical protein